MPKRSNIDFGAVCPFIYKFYLISNFKTIEITDINPNDLDKGQL